PPRLPHPSRLAGRPHGGAMKQILAVVLAVLAPISAAAADSAAVLKSLEQAGRSLKTMKADFAETKVLVILNEKQESKGTVILQVPGRFRWDYTAPQASVTLVRDGRFARYFPQTKQVFRG